MTACNYILDPLKSGTLEQAVADALERSEGLWLSPQNDTDLSCNLLGFSDLRL